MFSRLFPLARSASRSTQQMYVVFLTGRDKPKMRVPMTFWMAIVQLQMNCNRCAIIRSLNLNRNNYLHARNDSVEVRRVDRSACSQPTDQRVQIHVYEMWRLFCLENRNNIHIFRWSLGIAFLFALFAGQSNISRNKGIRANSAFDFHSVYTSTKYTKYTSNWKYCMTAII